MNRLSIRARLTLVYSALLVLAGVLLLGLTYLLVSRQFYGDVRAGVSPSSRPFSPPDEVARDIQDNALGTLLTQGAIALAIISTAAIALGWLVAGRLLQPLHRVTETARRIADAPAADRGLHERIALTGPHDEIKELADTFDVMLERLDHSFDGQRRFIANASHELRTPLTLNRALLEVAVHRRAASAETRQLGETLLEINSRHERLIDGLLLLARSERELVERSYVDLADIVEHVVAQLPPGNVEVHTETGEAPTTGNPVLLERLVQNLVENALRYNLPNQGWMSVHTTTAADGSAVLEVANTGPIVPRYDVPSLFEPFHRPDSERTTAATPGAGLGLSIVQSITRAHGGTVRADPRQAGGLVVTVTLPADPDSSPSTNAR